MVVGTCFLFCCCLGLDIEGDREKKPNILLLIADDLGYGDLGSFGGKSSTPHLDRLAANGLRFDSFYAGGPNCSPSRAALMTGRNPAKVGMYNYRPPNHPMHLRAEEVTIAELLKGEGYQTAHIGKWHLGCLPQDSSLIHPQPDEQGFEYSFGTENNAKPSHLNPVNFVRNGVALDTVHGYSCQILVDEAQSWFETHYSDSAPYFMYLAFHEPHAKVASPPEMVSHYAGYEKKDAEYLANVENLDDAIGRLVNYLDRQELLTNTMILFSSDNGSYRQASNGPLRAVKSYVYEGGIRVPGIVYWPGQINHPLVIHEPVGFVDILPTLCDILTISPSPAIDFDGQSFANIFRGEDFSRKKPLFWYFYRTSPEMALRMDRYTILGKDHDTIPRTHRFSLPDMEYIQKMQFASFELYDLHEDISQERSVFGQDSNSGNMQELIMQTLDEIQREGHYWKELPVLTDTAKYKRDWVKLNIP